MAVSYSGLWKILFEHGMQKKDLSDRLNISSATIAKMGKGDVVSMEVLQKICIYFECDIGDIVSFNREEN